jgi:subtilisin family serine protease
LLSESLKKIENAMGYLDLVKLDVLMKMTEGKPQIKVGLLDGTVLLNHPDLEKTNIREISGTLSGNNTFAIMHGTFVAGILSARRDSIAPAICPKCTLLIRPIFGEKNENNNGIPSTTPKELAQAIFETIEAGANCINLSLALAQPTSKGEQELEQALDYAAKHGVIIVAAAGNQGTLGSTAITRHSWVIPVVGCDLSGRPIEESNLGNSVGKRGITAPGASITSLGINGKPLTSGGTSAATPFVTGTIALLWSIFPKASAYDIKFAVTGANRTRRTSVVPPLLDAWGAYQYLTSNSRKQP